MAPQQCFSQNMLGLPQSRLSASLEVLGQNTRDSGTKHVMAPQQTLEILGQKFYGPSEVFFTKHVRAHH